MLRDSSRAAAACSMSLCVAMRGLSAWRIRCNPPNLLALPARCASGKMTTVKLVSSDDSARVCTPRRLARPHTLERVTGTIAQRIACDAAASPVLHRGAGTAFRKLRICPPRACADSRSGGALGVLHRTTKRRLRYWLMTHTAILARIREWVASGQEEGRKWLRC